MKKFLESNKRVLFLSILFFFCSSIFGQQLEHKNSSEIEGSGIGIHTSWLDLGPIRSDITEKMFQVGVKWCRLGVPWSYVEHESIGNYDFTSIDTIINQLVAHSITPYLILSDANELYNPNRYAPIPDSAAYFNAWLAYVDTVVKRYQDRVNHWEIWNEPNLDESWLPEANPLYYSALACSSSNVIRAIDADAVICLGGMALVDLKFIKACLESGVAQYVDKIGIHPYRTLPEAPQNLLVWSPNNQFESPYDSYEDEIRALKDTIALFDDSLEIWDTEVGFLSDSIYPDPLSPDPFNPQHSSETTQSKYLARRYILDLKQNIEITTWTVDWDLRSLSHNMGKSDWVNDYSELSDVDFSEAPFFGIIYTPQNTYTYTSEGEDYTLIFPPMEKIYDGLALGDSCIWTPDGTGDSGYVYYDFDLREDGWYTLWSRTTGNGEDISIFLTGLDELWFSIGNWYSASEYRWVPASSRYVTFFDLESDSHRLYVNTYLDGSRFDAWKLIKVDTNCNRKESYYTLLNLCGVFDKDLQSKADYLYHFENINADTASFNRLTSAAFEDTVMGTRYISYWFGIEARDDYQDRFLNLRVRDTDISSAVLINFINGSVNDIADYFVDDSLTMFDSLPVADFPYCIALNWGTGIGEDNGTEKESAKLEIYPNPFISSSTIRYSIPNSGRIELKLYNLMGQLVRTLAEGEHTAGNYTIDWDERDNDGTLMTSGIYLVKLKLEDGVAQSKKLLLFR